MMLHKNTDPHRPGPSSPKRLTKIGSMFRPPQPEDVLREYPRREIILGLTVGGLFLVVVFGLGMWVRLDAAVTAPGQVTVAGNRQTVQHRDGGIVSELDVKEGDYVKAGQVLLRLNSDELQATERADNAQVILLKALQARLLAELQGRDRVQYPSEFKTMIGVAGDDVRAAVALQNRLFITRNAALASEKEVLRQHKKESQEQITGYSRQSSANREQQKLIEQEISGLKVLLDRGLVPATRVRSLQRSASELRGSEGEYNATIAKTQEEIGESQIRINDLEKERAADDGKDYQSAQFQLADVEPKLAAVREQIDRTLVRAPATGAVVGLTIFTVGGVVAPAQKLMDIVPTDQPLVIEARVKPSDVSDVRVGQNTEIRITAFHNRNMPLLHGKVTTVSADSLTDEKTGIAYFTIRVTVPPSQLKLIRQTRGESPGLQAGLPVAIVIPLRPRTALEYFLDPIRQVLSSSFHEH